MKQMTCIVCPNGCTLQIDDSGESILVSGNRCKKGKDFAIAEITHPMRTICSTVATNKKEVPVIPVRVSGEIPKEKIFAVMEEINKVVVTDAKGVNEPIITNVLGLGVDVIVTSNILKEEYFYE